MIGTGGPWDLAKPRGHQSGVQTAKIEYDFLGLNNMSFTVTVGPLGIGGDVITTTNRDVQTLTVGVNYLFNWH
jgi:hypothetical protein